MPAFARENWWYLPVDADVDPALGQLDSGQTEIPAWTPSCLISSSARCARGRLLYRKAEKELICKPCRLAYPIRDDIPVMLEEEARKLPPEEEVVTRGSPWIARSRLRPWTSTAR